MTTAVKVREYVIIPSIQMIQKPISNLVKSLHLKGNYSSDSVSLSFVTEPDS